ncbi:hypothetical protein [Spirosoma pollinicola]|uniref:DUF4595 domain-containing protein n=1 Tax=Spirosoma pollinicola TaxID=2057025 RepID=A0A2K8YUT2_9BACT|nr:hypothetical protein [Spirosoma pollinicola]AUD01405.1 hypothetical protein CWM47_06030 [Spirosoma pollinicola]
MSTNSSVKSCAQLPKWGININQIFTINTLFSKIAVSLAVAIGSFACQNDNLVNPANPGQVANQATNNIIPDKLPKYVLIKDGPQTVSYYPDGRLKRVIYGADVPGNTNERTDYTYEGTQSVKATAVYNNKTYNEETFTLDAYGRCYQYREYVYPDGGVTKQKYVYNSSYTYDNQGRLKTWTSFAPTLTLQYEYSYTVDGDLSKVVRYNGDAADEEITFAYKLAEAPALLPDSYPLNAQLNFKWWGLLKDTYLGVFGTASTHLVKRVIRKNLITNQVEQDNKFTYTMNANGYVSNRTSVDVLTGVVRDSKAYEYVSADTPPTF